MCRKFCFEPSIMSDLERTVGHLTFALPLTEEVYSCIMILDDALRERAKQGLGNGLGENTPGIWCVLTPEQRKASSNELYASVANRLHARCYVLGEDTDLSPELREDGCVVVCAPEHETAL